MEEATQDNQRTTCSPQLLVTSDNKVVIKVSSSESACHIVCCSVMSAALPADMRASLRKEPGNSGTEEGTTSISRSDMSTAPAIMSRQRSVGETSTAAMVRYEASRRLITVHCLMLINRLLTASQLCSTTLTTTTRALERRCLLLDRDHRITDPTITMQHLRQFLRRITCSMGGRSEVILTTPLD